MASNLWVFTSCQRWVGNPWLVLWRIHGGEGKEFVRDRVAECFEPRIAHKNWGAEEEGAFTVFGYAIFNFLCSAVFIRGATFYPLQRSSSPPKKFAVQTFTSWTDHRFVSSFPHASLDKNGRNFRPTNYPNPKGMEGQQPAGRLAASRDFPTKTWLCMRFSEHLFTNEHTEHPDNVCMWLREISYCSCLTVLPGSACVLLSKKYILFPGSL